MTDDEVKALLDAIRQESAVAHSETRRHFDDAVARVESRSDATAKRIEGKFDVAVARLESKVDVAVARLETKVDAAVLRLETKFDVTAEHLENKFDLLAETVHSINEKFENRTLMLDKKIDQTTTETQALIKFLYDEHSRRILALESQQRKA